MTQRDDARRRQRATRRVLWIAPSANRDQRLQLEHRDRVRLRDVGDDLGRGHATSMYANRLSTGVLKNCAKSIAVANDGLMRPASIAAIVLWERPIFLPSWACVSSRSRRNFRSRSTRRLDDF